MRCSPRKVLHIFGLAMLLWFVNIQLLSPWKPSVDEEALQRTHQSPYQSPSDEVTYDDNMAKLRSAMLNLQHENVQFLNHTIAAVLAKSPASRTPLGADTQKLIDSLVEQFDTVSKSLAMFRNFSLLANQTNKHTESLSGIKQGMKPAPKPPAPKPPAQKPPAPKPPAPVVKKVSKVVSKKTVPRKKWDKNTTWPAPVTCPPKTGYHTGTLARTALASMEGSGNTWLRHMLQTSTGIFTGSIYNDKYLKANGFPAENVQDGRVVVIKTHDRNTSTHKKFDKAVLLLRSPYDTFLAELNRLYSHQDGNHTAYADPKIFKDGTSDWEFSFMGEKWRNFSKNWLQFPGPIAVVHYENFQTDFRNEMTKLLRFLQWEVTDSQLACVESNNEGKFHRKKKQLGFDPFTDKHRRELEGHKAAIQGFIEARQAKGLPLVS